MRLFATLSLLGLLVQPASAARPSGNAAMVRNLRPTLKKSQVKLLRSVGTAVAEENEQGERSLEAHGKRYVEWHQHGAGHSRADTSLGDGKTFLLSTSQVTTAKGKLLRQATVERRGEQHEIEVLEKKGLFTISHRVTVDKTRGGTIVQGAMKAIKLGRLRIPIGRSGKAVVDEVSRMSRAGEEIDAWQLQSNLESPALPVHPDTHDIALGLDHTSGRISLEAFGSSVGANVYTAWGERGVTQVGSEQPHEFAPRFHDAVRNTIKHGGRIKFDLTGILHDRLMEREGGAAKYGSITLWELAQLRGNPRYAAHTDFYRQDASGRYVKLSAKELEAP